MAGLAVPVFMIVFNDTAFNVSLASLMDKLGAGETAVSWLVTAYILASTALMPVGGQLGDVVGKRRVYLCGIALFGVGSVVCGAARSFPSLMAGRVVQGVGGAAIVPLSLALLADAVPIERRSGALGLWEAATPAGAVLGPVAGGVLMQWAGLSATLALVTVISVAGFALALRCVPSDPRRRTPATGEGGAPPAVRGRPGADMLGGVLLAVALTCLLLAIGGAVRGATAAALGVGGVAGLVALAAWERRAKNPILYLGAARGRGFVFALVGGFAVMFIGFGATISMPLYFGRVLGLGPLAVGLATLPRSLGQLVSTPLGGRLTGSFGSRLPAVAGMTLSALSLAAAAAGAVLRNLPAVVAGLAAFGFARGLCPAAYSSAATMGLTRADSGAGSGLYELARYGGALFGSAAFGVAIGAMSAAPWAGGRPEVVYSLAFASGAVLAIAGAAAGFGLPAVPTAGRPAPAAGRPAAGGGRE